MHAGLLPLYPSGTIIGAAPKQGLLCGGTVTKNSKKNTLPAVPLRGPEAGSFVYRMIFMVRV